LIASKAEDRGGERRDQLERRSTADGSLTLWSERFGECFHSGSGAYTEAINTFIQPAQLDRWAAGSQLRVLELCVGLGYNTAALLEAAAARALRQQSHSGESSSAWRRRWGLDRPGSSGAGAGETGGSA